MFLPIRSGLVLGVLVALWTLVMGYTGLYRDPRLSLLFVPGAIGLQLAVMVWSLAQRRREDPFLRQVLHGMVLSSVASVLIFLNSLLFTTVLFPGYFQDIQEMGRQVLAAQGRTSAEIEASLASYRAMATPFRNAFAGVMGTLATGMVLSLGLGVALRRRS